MCPRFGKKKLAKYFLRADIYISDTSIVRYLSRKWDTIPPDLTATDDKHLSRSEDFLNEP